ncbi:MAG: hypothetical protein K5856_04690 [Bacteroidaceae bacterium]|nr:hypothetical protein [Bacteroidaceae bacterium]
MLVATLLSSCGEDTYHYPSVKEEFFSGVANADGLLEYIITDNGTRRVVTEWGEHLTRLQSDTLFRLMGYYEELSADNVKVHSFVNAISPLPVPAIYYADSVATAPVIIQSAWLGNQYINMLLVVKAGGMKHRIVFLEENITGPDDTGTLQAVFSIHHNDGKDAQVYETRGYASLPLYPYLSPAVRQIDIKLNYLDYEGRERDYSFVYKP